MSPRSCSAASRRAWETLQTQTSPCGEIRLARLSLHAPAPPRQDALPAGRTLYFCALLRADPGRDRDHVGSPGRTAGRRAGRGERWRRLGPGHSDRGVVHPARHLGISLWCTR